VLCPPLEAFPFLLDMFSLSSTGVLKAIPLQQLNCSVNDEEMERREEPFISKRKYVFIDNQLRIQYSKFLS
jgi:hypothetical protein